VDTHIVILRIGTRSAWQVRAPVGKEFYCPRSVQNPVKKRDVE